MVVVADSIVSVVATVLSMVGVSVTVVVVAMVVVIMVFIGVSVDSTCSVELCVEVVGGMVAAVVECKSIPPSEPGEAAAGVLSPKDSDVLLSDV